MKKKHRVKFCSDFKQLVRFFYLQSYVGHLRETGSVADRPHPCVTSRHHNRIIHLLTHSPWNCAESMYEAGIWSGICQSAPDSGMSHVLYGLVDGACSLKISDVAVETCHFY